MGKGGGSKDATGDGFMRSLQRFDAFPKVNEDFFQRTLSGGVITLVAMIVMAVLFFSELRVFLTAITEYELSVDSSRGEQMRINLDVTFPRLPCSVISLDVMDVSGEQELDVSHNVFKRRLDSKGEPISAGTKEGVNSDKVDPELVAARRKAMEDENARKEGGTGAEGEEDSLRLETETTSRCGSCYGSERTPEQCCNTCEEVRESYRLKGWAFSDPEAIEQCAKEGFSENLRLQSDEGCAIYGYLDVNKVAGNFHFAPGKSFQHGNMHVHDLMPFHTKKFDMSHRISKVSFGADFPGVVNPLDGVERDMQGDAGAYQYFLKVVPTVFSESFAARGSVTSTNQFSVTDHFKPVDAEAGQFLPGVFFFYDLSPIKVNLVKRRKPFLEFLTSACAIVGGSFAVSGIIDAGVYRGEKAFRRKIDLGKQG
jgi:hypothetical protein